MSETGQLGFYYCVEIVFKCKSDINTCPYFFNVVNVT